MNLQALFVKILLFQVKEWKILNKQKTREKLQTSHRTPGGSPGTADAKRTPLNPPTYISRYYNIDPTEGRYYVLKYV